MTGAITLQYIDDNHTQELAGNTRLKLSGAFARTTRKRAPNVLLAINKDAIFLIFVEYMI